MTEKLLSIPAHAWAALQDLSPWLLLGLLLAGAMHVVLPPGFLRRHLGRRGPASVFRAALIGVPMPLCSCGVIPAAIGLRKEGASRGAAIGFLISTPQTGVDSLLVSANFLGWPFAIFKVFSALVTGVAGGILTDLADGDGDAEADPAETRATPASGAREHTREILGYAFGRLLGDIYVWIVVGVLAAGAISALVPANYFADKPWVGGVGGMFIMLLIAVPLYVCSTASVPIAAALVGAGMPAGAALVFLMAGPATNLATLGAVLRTFGARTAGIYLGTVAAGSLLLGGLFDFVLGRGTVPATPGDCLSCILPSWAPAPASLLMVALLLWHALRDLRARLSRGDRCG